MRAECVEDPTHNPHLVVKLAAMQTWLHTLLDCFGEQKVTRVFKAAEAIAWVYNSGLIGQTCSNITYPRSLRSPELFGPRCSDSGVDHRAYTTRRGGP